MHILIPILILLAILFRREMRGLVQLVGLVLFVIIAYFGICFVQWEKAHGQQTWTLAPGTMNTQCVNNICTYGDYKDLLYPNSGNIYVTSITSPEDENSDDPIKLLKHKWWLLAMTRWQIINNFRDEVKRLNKTINIESEDDNQWKTGDRSQEGLPTEIAHDRQSIFEYNAKLRAIEKAIDAIQKTEAKK